MSILKKTVIEKIDTSEVVEEVVEQLKKKKIPTKRLIENLPPTIEVKWKNKKKGLIICNACGGTGKRESRYGSWTECAFCEGTKVIQIKEK